VPNRICRAKVFLPDSNSGGGNANEEPAGFLLDEIDKNAA